MPFHSLAAKEDFRVLAKEADRLPRRGVFGVPRADGSWCPACLIGLATVRARGDAITFQDHAAITERWGLSPAEQDWLSCVFEQSQRGDGSLLAAVDEIPVAP